MASATPVDSASFSVQRTNKSTFLLVEDDAYREHPFIYVKLHPKVVIVSDTGCDEPSEKKKHAKIIHLRDYIENFPVPENGDAPLNPKGSKPYLIICSHCHYDHIGGISQFLAGGTTEIVASAAGRDFIEHDFERHSLFKYMDKPAPWYQVTHWAPANSRLRYPIEHHDESSTAIGVDARDLTENAKPTAFTGSSAYRYPSQESEELGITILHTPGHTPDSLAWYDHDEMHLFVGDTLYEEGPDGMAIQFPNEGDMFEWWFSLKKLLAFVSSKNDQAKEDAVRSVLDTGDHRLLTIVGRRVKLGAGHQTHSADAEELILKVAEFWKGALVGKIPVVKREYRRGDAYFTWREKDGASGLSMQAPARLMDHARALFGPQVVPDS